MTLPTPESASTPSMLEQRARQDAVEAAAKAMAAADSGPQGSELFNIHWTEFGPGYLEGAAIALEIFLSDAPTFAPAQPAPLQGREERTCTCHPEDKPPQPCAQKYAYRECVAASPPQPGEPSAEEVGARAAWGEAIEAAAKDEWQSLIEKDDRTSPEEYPEMALITFDELCAAMLAALSAPLRTVAEEPWEVEAVAEAIWEANETVTWGKWVAYAAIHPGHQSSVDAVRRAAVAALRAVSTARGTA